MVYTKVMLGYDLKEELSKGFCIPHLSRQFHRLYLLHAQEVDEEVHEVLKELYLMEDDSRFEFSEEELNELADYLISLDEHEGHSVNW